MTQGLPLLWGDTREESSVQGIEQIKIRDRTATALFRARRPHNDGPWELVRAENDAG